MIPVLTSLQRRARSEPWLLSGLQMGLSFSSVYRTLLTAGTAYRRTEMLRRWNDLKGFTATVLDIETMYVDKPIPDVRHLYPEGSIGDAYRYRTMTTLRHYDTEEERKEPFTILSDRRLSLEEIEADVAEFLLRYPDFEIYYVEVTHLTEASKRKD